MCKYLLDLTGFNADKPKYYYDSKTKLSIISLSYTNSRNYICDTIKVSGRSRKFAHSLIFFNWR